MSRLYLILILLLSGFCQIWGQAPASVPLTVHLLNSRSEAIPFAIVSVKGQAEGMADSTGTYVLRVPANNYYSVRVSSLGYRSADTVMYVTNAAATCIVLLQDAPAGLAAVRVTADTHGASLTKDPIKAQVIQTLATKEQPATLTELMNRSAGIRIRQAGALGSRSNISLNGFQNRSVRYFKDGMPLDYLGFGFNISLIPVNMLDHVEVYKGVLPLQLGADALGGAVNLVTREARRNFADISYEYGSFNTHRISLNAGLVSADGRYFGGVNAFYNYSKGNYRVEVEAIDEATGRLKPITTRLFHNAFSNYFIEAYGGLKNVVWADELRIMVTGFALKKEFQFGATMFKPFGAATGKQHSIVPAVRYKKGFFGDRLQLSEFAEINTLHASIADTLHGHYDWRGNFTPNPAEHGEISPEGTLSDIRYHYFTSHTNLSYALTPQQQLGLNVVVNKFMRKGSDSRGAVFPDGSDFLSEPAHYTKIIAALGLKSSFWNNRLENNFIIKYYHYRTEASDLNVTGERLQVRTSNRQWGIADGIKYKLGTYSLLQLSAETALRMPEQDELFGDGNLKLANFQLKPERSLNMGLSYQTDRYRKYHFETSVFYRRTRNMILVVPLYFMNKQSQNVDDVRGMGIEADGRYYLRPWLQIWGNLTYQDLRLTGTGRPTTEGARLRNTPYFFGNLGLQAKFDGLLSGQDKLELNWYYSYVRQYYLDYIPKSMEPEGFLGLWGAPKMNAENVIPDQNLHTAGFTYYPIKKPLAISFLVKNIFDANVYDHFKIQNPGRSFSIKISYSL